MQIGKDDKKLNKPYQLILTKCLTIYTYERKGKIVIDINTKI